MALEVIPIRGEFGAAVIGAPPNLRVDDATLHALTRLMHRRTIEGDAPIMA